MESEWIEIFPRIYPKGKTAHFAQTWSTLTLPLSVAPQKKKPTPLYAVVLKSEKLVV